MILDATELEAGHGLDCDTCIVGAGAAGITLALELAGRGQAVCVLEAGGESYSAAAQRLMDGTVEADGYPELRRTRLAALGGTTGGWAGWVRPRAARRAGGPDRRVAGRVPAARRHRLRGARRAREGRLAVRRRRSAAVLPARAPGPRARRVRVRPGRLALAPRRRAAARRRR